MPFGIIEARTNDQLPGTELLVSDEQTGEHSHEEAAHLKRITRNGVDTILVPQPSDDDPNDPLLWPRWKKETVFVVIFTNSVILAVLPSPLLAASTLALAGILDVPLTEISELSGYPLLVAGAIGPLVSVLAQKYGKRPQFLFAAVMATVGTIICIAGAEQTNYNTLLAGRIIQGFGVTAWESLSLAAVGDIFYLHERGWRTAFIVLSLACMASMVSIISGVMTETVGWRYLFIASLPFDVFGLLCTIFLLPETQFRRKKSSVDPAFLSHGGKVQSERIEISHETKGIEDRQHEARPTIKKMTYVQSLKPFSGTYSEENIFRLLVDIFVHLLNPAVFWILAVSAVLVSFFVASAYITAQIWSVPPYNLNTAQNGYFYAGAFIGGVAAVFIGPICDWSARWMARRNNGVFEAEFRIPVNILGALFCGLGWLIFMWDVNNPRPDGYYLGAVCHAFVSFGVSVPSTAAGLYILDSFPKQSTEIFILQMMLKNFLFYAFSTFVNEWAVKKGPGDVFKIFGIVSLALLATCIPMYILGKLNRKFMHGLATRFNFL